MNELKDRYCKCKTLCVWVPTDSPVWSAPPKAYQAYCPSCNEMARECYEKNSHSALILTPLVSFEIFKANKNLTSALAEQDKRIADLEALVEKLKCCQNCGNHLFASMHRCKCWYKVEAGCSDSSKWIPPFPFVKEADDDCMV